MADQRSLVTVLTDQRDALKLALYWQNQWGLKRTAILLATLGLAVVFLWYFTNDNTTMSLLLMLTGVSLIAIAILLYFFSPYRYIRSEVCDAMALSNALTIRKILASLLVDTRGIYIPASQAGATRLYVPLKEISTEEAKELSLEADQVFNVTDRASKGIVIYPPGHSLFLYVQRTGALFTEAGLGNEIKDSLENNLEIASDVSVRQEAGKVIVKMSRIATAGMCNALRQEDPGICLQMGCPICSLVGCMIADGTGKRARVDSVSVEGKTITLAFELIGE